MLFIFPAKTPSINHSAVSVNVTATTAILFLLRLKLPDAVGGASDSSRYALLHSELTAVGTMFAELGDSKTETTDPQYLEPSEARRGASVPVVVVVAVDVVVVSVVGETVLAVEAAIGVSAVPASDPCSPSCTSAAHH